MCPHFLKRWLFPFPWLELLLPFAVRVDAHVLVSGWLLQAGRYWGKSKGSLPSHVKVQRLMVLKRPAAVYFPQFLSSCSMTPAFGERRASLFSPFFPFNLPLVKSFYYEM